MLTLICPICHKPFKKYKTQSGFIEFYCSNPHCKKKDRAKKNRLDYKKINRGDEPAD